MIVTSPPIASYSIQPIISTPGSAHNTHNTQHTTQHTHTCTAFLPSGVQYNVPSSKLSGWVKYFDQPYSQVTKQADLTRGLPGGATHIMVCGSRTGSASLMLCAAASKADVLRKTSSTSSASGPYNGVYWYNYVGKSFGFSDSRSIGLYSADTNSGSGRLSWHIDQGMGGYRIGNAKFLYNFNYRKQLYYLGTCHPCLLVCMNMSLTKPCTQAASSG